jgi:hypothetical protein
MCPANRGGDDNVVDDVVVVDVVAGRDTENGNDRNKTSKEESA